MITNAERKILRSLSSRKGRRDHAKFAAEGVRLLEEALRHSFLPETLLFAESEITDRARKLVDSFGKNGVNCRQVPARQLRQISDVQAPQGILGVFAIPPWYRSSSENSREPAGSESRMLLVCESISDPGNLGTLMRSALGFDFRRFLLIGECVDAYSPKVVRSSAGSVFGLRPELSDVDGILKLASRGNFRIIATDVDGDDDLDLLANRVANQSLILAVGSEATGLSREILAAADFRIRIRHTEQVESLNAAVAGSIVMNRLFSSIEGA